MTQRFTDRKERLLDRKSAHVHRPRPHARPEDDDPNLWKPVPPPVGLASRRQIR
jgi:hypothetical protein